MRLLLWPIHATLLFGLAAAPAQAESAAARQEGRLEAGKSALEKLRSDPRRRRYREGWEAVERELDQAVRAAPSGRRAAEAALWAGRARAERWEVSRAAVDARAAAAAFRKVDGAYEGSPQAAQALLGDLQLALRTHDAKEAARATHRLAARYAYSSEARAAAELAAKEAKTRPVPPIRVKAAAAKGPAEPARHNPQLPVELDDEDAAAANPAPSAVDGQDDSRWDEEAQSSDLIRQIVEAAGTTGGQAGSPASAATAVSAATAAAGSQPLDPVQIAAADAEDDPSPAARARGLRTLALSSAGGSVAAQLGLRIRKVVIDPGHGGKDTGAIGPHGVREKDVALAIARKVAAKVRGLGLAVVLTRADDSFVSLEERTRIANQAKADLFVSIHCNAARQRGLAGVETWTLNVGSDRYSARLAEFENADADRNLSDLRLILADLATKANAGDARELAQAVQSSLVRGLAQRVGKVRDHGVKQALFYVLLGAHMPSILVETAFISNPSEEARLKSARYQDGAAEGIARGVREFVDGRRRLALAP